jgi:hypothetical protein
MTNKKPKRNLRTSKMASQMRKLTFRMAQTKTMKNYNKSSVKREKPLKISAIEGD